jgi:hypothetical protein
MPGVWMAALFARELIQAPLILPLAHRFRTGQGRAPSATALGRAASIAVALALAMVVAGYAYAAAVAVAGLLSAASGLHYAWLYARAARPPEATGPGGP